MKKKVLFCVYGLGIGGIEKCLVNLVNALNPQLYDVSIAVMNPEYDLLPEIRSDVTLIPFEENFVNTTDTMSLLKRQPLSTAKIAKFIQYVIYRLAVKFQIYPWKVQRTLTEQYDVAVAYTHVGHVPNYVLDRVKAKRKVLWYHTLWIDQKCLQTYMRFDQIVAVSQCSKRNFTDSFPALSDKVSILYNVYDLKDIKLRAEIRPPEFSENVMNIVTVGRLSEEKGYDLAIKASSLLKQWGYHKLRWYWVGDGPERVLAERAINNENLSDVFVLVGSKNNPYSYINHCDLYVQTSRREAFCTTIIEAKALHKPIVSTQNGSVCEQLTDGYDGIICGVDAFDIATQIASVIADNGLKNKLISNSEFDNNLQFNCSEYDKFFLS